MSDDDDRGTTTKVIITIIILILMVPGLIVEPGPLSEIVGAGAILTVWGLKEDD